MGRNIAREVVLADLGEAPWVCECGCGAVIEKIGTRAGEGHIHHVDENTSNNVRSNLMLLLGRCHRRHHQVGRIQSATERENRKIALTGNPRVIEGAKRRWRDPAERERQSARSRDALRKAWETRRANA